MSNLKWKITSKTNVKTVWCTGGGILLHEKIFSSAEEAKAEVAELNAKYGKNKNFSIYEMKPGDLKISEKDPSLCLMSNLDEDNDYVTYLEADKCGFRRSFSLNKI
jgi:hypothetical protein